MNELLANIGLISYATAAIAFALLCMTVALSPLDKAQKTTAVCAILASVIWSLLIAIGTLFEYPPLLSIRGTEVIRDAAWIYFLLQLISLQSSGTTNRLGTRHWRAAFIVSTGVVAGLQLGAPWLANHGILGNVLATEIEFMAWLAVGITGVILLEQLFRNSAESSRWSLKFLFIGLGCIFVYDIYLYSSALLLKRLDPQLWQARGFVNAIAAPFLAMAIARLANWQPRLQPSRQLVFHSAALTATGVYLMAMALAGYFIKYVGGDWGSVLQVSFLVAASALLLVLLFSGQIRARTRVFLNKHLFKYKYEYRGEWLTFTQALASSSRNAPEAIIKAMASLVNSPGGLLWARDSENRFQLICHWQMPLPENKADITDIAAWQTGKGWIIDVQEWRDQPENYPGLWWPDWLDEIADAWLLIPLSLEQGVQGVLLLRKSELTRTLNWEDRDLLKTAGSQAAANLAQYQATQELVMARQFEAFNRLSAYVVHDLKNILAQQSLMVANAEKHRDKPAFVDDMVQLMDNSVSRMTALMDQMRSGVRGTDSAPVLLSPLLEAIVAERAKQLPAPNFENMDADACVNADAAQLSTVFDHLIQNAQEATRKNGWVKLRLFQEHDRAIVEVEDNGVGMDQDFLTNRLFTPFDSTKGLTGMGIGAFESREFVRSLDGDILVRSTPGEGSLFRVVIPCTAGNPAAH